MSEQERNAICKCGSEKKYKKCCYVKDEHEKLKNERVRVFTEFMEIKDPRDNRGKRYALIDLFIMVIYGILNGHEDFDNIADFLKVNKKYFKNLLFIESTPSHDCLSDLFAVIDPKEFVDIFIRWIRGIVKTKKGTIIALDGKAVRSARDKVNGGNTPYILSAYLSEIGISIGQVSIAKKSNEITAIPELLKLMDIQDCTITIDALGTHEKIARRIVECGGHFVLKVKGNQKTLLKDIKTRFDTLLDSEEEHTRKETETERKHGRKEYREYRVLYDTSCITDSAKWDTVKAIGMVRVYRCSNDDKLDITDHFYIMDIKISLDDFARTTRNHWNIECGLHWRLDVIMNEDRSRNRKGHSIHNLSLIRKVVFNLVRLDTSFGKLTFKKKLIRYKFDFNNIENLIFNVLPEIHA